MKKKPNVFAAARAVVVKTLKKDAALRQTYVDNMAMVLHDQQVLNGRPLNFKDKNTRDVVAERLLTHILGK